MAKFRFTIREVLTWTTWLALYLGLRRTLFVRNGYFDIERVWIEAHLGLVFTAVAIDRFFRPDVRGRTMFVRGMTIGACATTIFSIEQIATIGRLHHLFEHFPSLWNSTPKFTAVILGGFVSGAVFGFLAVLFYSFLTLRPRRGPPLDDPPRSPANLPDNRSPAHDRAPP